MKHLGTLISSTSARLPYLLQGSPIDPEVIVGGGLLVAPIIVVFGIAAVLCG
jgi:hypothetical protein